MIQTLLLSVLIIAICFALLSVRVLLKKGGKFRSMHIHDSEAMRKRGIHCVIDEDRSARMEGRAFSGVRIIGNKE